MDICRKYVELHDKIKNVKIGMLTVQDEKGRLRSMPMITIQTECEGYIWFFTSCDSEKVDEIRRNPNVNVSYSDNAGNVYVSITGKAEMIDDKGKIKSLWKSAMDEWFPEGLQSRNIGLLKVEMQQAEYWNGKDMVQIWDTTDVVKTNGEFPELIS